MRKLLLLIVALLGLGVSGAWADGLKVSTTESANAEYQYKIFCRNASTYYLGNTTNATNSGVDYGLFAFFADNSGDYTNGYYIYSIFEGKWVTYTAGTSYSGGMDKVSLTSDKPTVPWHIATDDTNDKYYDIRPFNTDTKAADNQSWNWHGGAGKNTNHTMGFYSYTDGNSGWGIILAGGSGSPVADRKVVALYNVPNDNNEYPMLNDAKVSSSTSSTPQYFVLLSSGIDTYGEAVYKILKAEGNGKYLDYQGFSDTGSDMMFLNTSSYFNNNYTYTSGSEAESPYYNLFRKVSGDKPYEAWVAKCSNEVVNRYTNPYNTLNTPLDSKGNWNARWKVTELAGYTAWQVVMSGATSGTITYNGSALISGGTATQSNNGFFVLNATPATSDFSTSEVEGYFIDPVLTIDNDRKLIKVAYSSYTETYSSITNALDNAPEGIGYPTATARTRLQAAIDAFDASKTTANFTTLNTQYNSFLTNVVLPEGKVYMIQSYVKSPSKTAYLENIEGTLTISEDASATVLNNLWVVRKSGTTYVLQSAADPTKYIVYNSFTLNATGAAWTLSCGTEWPYISLYNSSLGGGRYVACDPTNSYFGTAVSGQNYYGSSKTQSNGWSTDFKFVESTDYALYKVKILYPSGSAPTVTYNATAYSNGSDFIAPSTLTTNDLTVSEISGYTPTITIDGDIVYVNYNMAVTAPYVDTWNFDNSPWSLLNDAPAAIDKVGRTYRYNTKRINIATTYNSSVEVVFAYSSGDYRIDVAGVDLIDPSTGDVVKGDYHDGYSGSNQSKREYSIRDVASGNYILRYISYDQSTSSAGNISVRVVPGQGFYRLKNVATGKYLTATATGAWDSSTRYVYANGNSTDVSTVIRLYEKDNNGALYMYNQGYGFGWTATNHGGHVAWITSNPDKYVNWFSGTADGQVAFAICFGNGTGDYASYLEKGIYTADTSDDAIIAGDDKSANAAQWAVEEATSVTIPLTTVSGKSYATFSAPFPVTIGDDAKAYTVKLEGDKAVYSEISSKQIPANAGILLISEIAAASVTATISNSDFSALSNNDLVGFNLSQTFSYTEENNAQWNLVLGNSASTGIGFYKMSGTASGNKAYLPYTYTEGNVKGFTLVAAGDETGISEIAAGQNTQNTIYNIAGQRVSQPTRGLYIVNGKKVVIK